MTGTRYEDIRAAVEAVERAWGPWRNWSTTDHPIGVWVERELGQFRIWADDVRLGEQAGEPLDYREAEWPARLLRLAVDRWPYGNSYPEEWAALVGACEVAEREAAKGREVGDAP